MIDPLKITFAKATGSSNSSSTVPLTLTWEKEMEVTAKNRMYKYLTSLDLKSIVVNVL